MGEPSPPHTVEPQYVIAAQAAELARVNDNRVYLMALIDQQGQLLREQARRIAELEAAVSSAKDTAPVR
jgi:hypothetical protein